MTTMSTITVDGPSDASRDCGSFVYPDTVSPRLCVARIRAAAAQPEVAPPPRGRHPPLAQGVLLSGGAIAGVYLQLGAVGGVVGRVVEAQARLRVKQGPVGLRFPDLVGAAVAVPQVDLGADRDAAGTA